MPFGAAEPGMLLAMVRAGALAAERHRRLTHPEARRLRRIVTVCAKLAGALALP